MWTVPQTPSWPIVVSEPRFNVGYDRGSRSIAEKLATAVQAPCVGPFAEKATTVIQVTYSFCLRENMMNWWTHTWGGVFCASCSSLDVDRHGNGAGWRRVLHSPSLYTILIYLPITLPISNGDGKLNPIPVPDRFRYPCPILVPALNNFF